MRIRIPSFCLALVLALALPQAGIAGPEAAPKLLGSFGAWKAYAYGGDKPVCYMSLTAHFPPNKKLKRSDAYLMITHRPAENAKDVVSYAAGYVFKPASDVQIAVGKKSFDLFTQKDTAWSRDAATDHALTAAIRDGAIIKITGTPAAKGAASAIDTLDLKGSGPAYRAIGKACGYPEETSPKPASARKKKSAKN